MDGFLAWAGTIFVGAGLGTVVGNLGVELVKGKFASKAQQRDLAHQRDIQREERAHQAELRWEAAIADARRELVPLVAAAREHIYYELGTDWADITDVYSRAPAPELKNVSEALRALDRVATSHPAPHVRSLGRGLYDAMEIVYGQPEFAFGQNIDEAGKVPRETYASWIAELDRLIDALNNPQHELNDRNWKPGT